MAREDDRNGRNNGDGTRTRTDPGPPISRDDLEAKFRELQGEAEVIGEEARSYALTVAIVVVVAVVGVAFVLGRHRGRRNRTIVEVRRI